MTLIQLLTNPEAIGDQIIEWCLSHCPFCHESFTNSDVTDSTLFWTCLCHEEDHATWARPYFDPAYYDYLKRTIERTSNQIVMIETAIACEQRIQRGIQMAANNEIAYDRAMALILKLEDEKGSYRLYDSESLQWMRDRQQDDLNYWNAKLAITTRGAP